MQWWITVGIVLGIGVTPSLVAAQQPPADPQQTQPQRRTRRPIPDDVKIHRDVVFGKGGDRPLKMHIVRPKESAQQKLPVYVWIHGGGWFAGRKESGLARLVRMAREGFAGATIEYRLTGEAPFPAQIEDCKCAIRFLRAHADKYGLDPDRIAVASSSAGGHLVALLGTSGGVKELEGNGGWEKFSSRVQAVVDFYGPTDLIQFVKTPGYESHARPGSPEARLLGGVPLERLEMAAKANPITYVDKNDPPFLIFHGDQDPVVPPNQSTLLRDALRQAGVRVELHILRGARHGGPQFSSPQVLKQELTFLRAALKTTSESRAP